LEQDATTSLFDLRGLAVVRVERAADGTRIVHARTDEPTAAACPRKTGLNEGQLPKELRLTRRLEGSMGPVGGLNEGQLPKELRLVECRGRAVRPRGLNEGQLPKELRHHGPQRGGSDRSGASMKGSSRKSCDIAVLRLMNRER